MQNSPSIPRPADQRRSTAAGAQPAPNPKRPVLSLAEFWKRLEQ